MDISAIKKVEVDGARLAVERERRGLSLDNVGKQTGLDRRQVWQIEQGKSQTITNVTKLAMYYSIPLESLLKIG